MFGLVLQEGTLRTPRRAELVDEPLLLDNKQGQPGGALEIADAPLDVPVASDL